MNKVNTDLKEKKKELVMALLNKNVLLSPAIFHYLKTISDEHEANQLLSEISVRTRDEIERTVLPRLSSKTNAEATPTTHTKSQTNNTLQERSGVSIIFSYSDAPKKREVKDFVDYFNARYIALEKILRQRQELNATISIGRTLLKTDRDTVSIIGLVKDKQITKRGNVILTLEDPTGEIKIAVTASKQGLLAQAKELVLDEVIGVSGVTGDKIIFAQNIFWPDVPLNKELKKANDEAYAAFLSDIHVGSLNFLEEKFNKFLRWIRAETGTEEQKKIAQKVKYIFIVGDLVEGVGIYPNQVEELKIKDIYKQYVACAALLKQIPVHINIVVCPGNHDAVRIAEPQPLFDKNFAAPLWELPNIIFVSNPAQINMHRSDSFPGFDVLLYHGYSFDYFVANVDSIRTGGGYGRPDLIMKFLMQRRHLAPTHTSTLYIPDALIDPLVIEAVPDFFVTGHVHTSAVANYKNITMICGSCWQDTTSFQEKVGHKPEPARVPVVNLMTRKTRILRF